MSQPQLNNLFSLDGGLNISQSSIFIEDSQSSDMKNIVVDKYGNTRKRPGTIEFPIFPPSLNRCDGLYKTYQASGDKSFLCLTEGHLFQFTGTANNTLNYKVSVWDLIATSVYTSGKKSQFVSYGDNTYIFFEDRKAPLKYSHVSATAKAMTTSWYGKYAAVHKNYFCQFNVTNSATSTTFGSRLVVSKLAAPETYATADNYDIYTDDGDSGTGLGSLNDTLYLFKDRQTFGLVGDNLEVSANNTVLVPIAKFGVMAPYTLQNVGDKFIFLAHDGFRIFDGTNSEIIDKNIIPIRNIILENKNSITPTSCYWPKENLYLVAYNDPGVSPTGMNNSILTFDFNRNQWYLWDGLYVGAFAVFNGVGDQGELYYGDSNSGFVRELSYDSLNDPTPINVLMTLNNSNTISGMTITSGTVAVEGIYYATSSAAGNGSATGNFDTTTVMNFSSFVDNSDISLVSTAQNQGRFVFYVAATINHSAKSPIFEIRLTNSTSTGNYFSAVVTTTHDVSGLAKQNWIPVFIDLSSFAKTGTPTLTNITRIHYRWEHNAGAGTTLAFDGAFLTTVATPGINAYRTTKDISVPSPLIDKHSHDIYIVSDTEPDSDSTLDYIGEFGKENKSINFSSDSIDHLYWSWFGSGVATAYKENPLLGGSWFWLNVLNSSSTSQAIVTSITVTLNTATAMYLAADDDFVYFARDNKIDIRDKVAFGLISSATFSTGMFNDLTCDEKYIFAVSSENILYRIDKKELKTLDSMGSSGTATANFDSPYGICNDNLYIYVADFNNKRIMKYKKDFTYVSSVVLPNTPVGVDVDAEYLYVNVLISGNTSQLYKIRKSDMKILLISVTSSGGSPNMRIFQDSKYIYWSGWDPIENSAQQMRYSKKDFRKYKFVNFGLTAAQIYSGTIHDYKFSKGNQRIITKGINSITNFNKYSFKNNSIFQDLNLSGFTTSFIGGGLKQKSN